MQVSELIGRLASDHSEAVRLLRAVEADMTRAHADPDLLREVRAFLTRHARVPELVAAVADATPRVAPEEATQDPPGPQPWEVPQ